MNREQLYQQILAKKTMLCVGLDVDYAKMPEHIKGLASSEIAVKGQLFGGKTRSIIEFNKAIIDATAPYCVAYKPNLAFYECYGMDGIRALEATVDYIRTTYPDIFLIADAKRGDIGNTAKMYAKAFFESMDFDAVTLSPYMGQDSIIPFLEYKDKWAIVLALTSNASAVQYQLAEKDGKPLYRNGHTPAFPMLYAQVTRRFKGVDIYIGGENLTGFRQKDVILGVPDAASGVVNARQPSFDASAVWGPLMGARFYAGVRFTLWKGM